MLMTYRLVKGSILSKQEMDDNLRLLDPSEFGFGSDVTTQIATFAGAGISGSAPVTTWADSFGSGVSWSGVGATLNADGSVRTTVDGAGIGSNLKLTRTGLLLPSNRVLLLIELSYDKVNNTTAGSFFFTAFSASGLTSGFALDKDNFWFLPAFDGVLWTHPFVQERMRFAILIDRTALQIWCMRIGTVTGLRVWTQLLTGKTLGNWVGNSMVATLGADTAQVSRLGTHDWYGSILLSGIPAFTTDGETYAYMRAALTWLKTLSSPTLRQGTAASTSAASAGGGAAEFGFSADVATQIATLAGVGITGATPVTLWSDAFGLGVAWDGNGSNLNANGSIRSLANGASSNVKLLRTGQLLTSNKIMLLLDFEYDVLASITSGTYLFTAFGAGLTSGFALESNILWTLPGFAATILTYPFLRERQRFGIVIDRNATPPTIWCVKIGAKFGVFTWTQLLTGVAMGNWIGTPVTFTLGNDSTQAGHVGAHDWYGSILMTNLPTLSDDQTIFSYIRGALTWLGTQSSAMVRQSSAGASTFVPTTGPQDGAPPGRKWTITGNITNVPIANGFEALYVNRTAGSLTITPVSGLCVAIEIGTTAASIQLAANKAVVVMGDGTDLLIMGDIV